MLTNRFVVLLSSNISKLKTWQTDELENFMMLSPIHFKHPCIAVLNADDLFVIIRFQTCCLMLLVLCLVNGIPSGSSSLQL
uniref:Uncharacterized protein n=1 Tax=Triticum urartu TaxID=4572 RepID=A0A8R7PMA9_TRIUA